MEKGKKKNRRLLLLGILTTFLFMMLSMSTFAWFTSNRTISIDDIQVNVAAAGGVQISVDGSSWKSMINNTELLAANVIYPAAVNQIPSELAATSSGLNIDASGLMEMYSGTVSARVLDGEYILSTLKSTEVHGTAGEFVAFDLFFRLDAASTSQIYLTTSSGVIADGADSGIKNAARVAFVDLGNVVIGSTLATIQAINDGTPVVTLWEPNFDSHTAPAVNNAFDTYGLTVADGDATLVPYDGVIDDIAELDDVLVAEADAINYPLFFQDVAPDVTTDSSYSTALTFEPLLTLTPGTITKLRFYLWMEGQDVDCENAASGSNVIYNIQLSLNDQ